MPRARNTLPPATLFVCQPTPSYVVSPQFAARLPNSDLSLLATDLKVYEISSTERTVSREVITGYEERDCTPEVLIDQDLDGDQAIYYGHGQVHIIGMLDIHRGRMMKDPDFASDAALQRCLAEDFVHSLPGGSLGAAANPFEDSGSWFLCNTDEGFRKIAYVRTNVDRSEGIATASITLNIAVPMAGLDPEQMCPYDRIDSVSFTSIWAMNGNPASDLGQTTGGYAPPRFSTSTDTPSSAWVDALRMTMQCTMNVDAFPGMPEVGYARALGEYDPDLEPE